MKLPSFKDLDYKKIIAVAILILAVTIAAILLSNKFSSIKVLGIELETKTESVEKEIPKSPTNNFPNRRENRQRPNR
jgi:hypothetical protein